ncbi:MAG: arginine--tRNA ligase, partial [Muribaculaceae bacterium]|nr:arginine--tRNA ligase [Muribaculaceae bacterium]
MSIDRIIAQAVAHALKELYNIDVDAAGIVPETTKKEFEGNLTVIVFPWVKTARKAPAVVGKEIGDWLVENEPAVSRYNVINGFLNIVIEPGFWCSVLRHIEETPHYGITEATADSPLYMVEYSSPNTNKPLH